MNELREAKELMLAASDGGASTMRRLDDLVLAVNILIGLMEGHRHHVDTDFRVTGQMQAMEGR
jgi:hypothetical protein